MTESGGSGLPILKIHTMKRKFSLIEVIVLIVTFVLCSLIFTNWDLIKNWLF